MRYYDFREQMFLSSAEVGSWHLTPAKLITIDVLPVNEPSEHTNLLTVRTSHHLSQRGNFAVLTFEERNKNHEELQYILPEIQNLKRPEFQATLVKLDACKMRPLSALTFKQVNSVAITDNDEDVKSLQMLEDGSALTRERLRIIENATLPSKAAPGQTLDESAFQYLESLLALKPWEGTEQ